MALYNVKIRHLNNVKMWPDLIPVKPKFPLEDSQNSSLILSPSSSGESLVSCDLMLDYKDSTCSGLITKSGDSALLDLEESSSSVMSPNRNKVLSSIVSTEVLCTSSGVPQRIMVNSNTRRSSSSQRINNGQISPVATSTPISSFPNNSKPSVLNTNKVSPNSYISHRDRISQNQNNSSVCTTSTPTTTTTSIQASQNSLQNNHHGGSRGRLSSIPSPVHDISSSKMTISVETPTSIPSNTKLRTQNNNNNNNNTNNLKSPYRYPRNSSPGRISLSSSPNKSLSSGSGIIRKSNNNNNEVNNINSSTTTTPTTTTTKKECEVENFLPDSFVKEVLTEVLECKNQLEELKCVLETTEKEVMDKEEIIQRQKKEIEYWKNTALGMEMKNNSSSLSHLEKPIHINHSDNNYKEVTVMREDGGDYWGKEKELLTINTMVKETANACSQTENYHQPKPAVTYPDENDKMGQLVR